MLLALALSAAAFGAGSADRPPLHCARSGRTIAQNTQARIFQRRGREGFIVSYGCVLPRGRVQRLARYDDFEIGRTLEQLTLTGRHVGFADIGCDGPAGEYCAAQVIVRDLRRRAVVRSADAYDGRSFSENVSDLALARDGDVAWISFSEDPDFPSEVREVHTATTRGGSALLDSGEDVALRSLAVAGRLVYWTRGGVANSARLP